ncbi:hypothetical protein RIF29_08550 [Crotalaria pallida]|uniref:RING-type E3 ubiquitin transferase n=1 Tax=Crotalaria pallida TaxID=3830 RepID=A0AAN9FQX7_CROPI
MAPQPTASNVVKHLPCDSEGVCMLCKTKPTPVETLLCNTCVTPWHVSCLPAGDAPTTLVDAEEWQCHDCSTVITEPLTHYHHTNAAVDGGGLVAAIRAIQSDATLTDQEKAKKRQELMDGSSSKASSVAAPIEKVFDISDESLNCSICMQLPERPVTTPCGHNFCLKCFQKCFSKGNRKCANCRATILQNMVNNPRINSQLAIAIRLAKMARSGFAVPRDNLPKVYHPINNEDRPDTAFTTENAKKNGLANACTGRIFVTVPKDHFGPIPAENDPTRNRGVLVGDTWMSRIECTQWGAHVPHIAGICGQGTYGAQSVALSGGYVDDEDHGEWFLYTGSGGKDLTGNKRTNKSHSFHQEFVGKNEALRLSCLKGYPVRVVRSSKEKCSAYAPSEGVRYDGVYRIEKCWRKIGKQGYKVCRYLFVRCDNDPAPWTSDDCGDRPRSLPKIKELKGAIDITERKEDPSWDYDAEKGCWLWKRPAPESRKAVGNVSPVEGPIRVAKRKGKRASGKEKLLKDFGCQICRDVLTNPLTTPCAHNFCKACLEGAFSGQSYVRQRVCQNGRSLRAQKNIMKCPSCENDIAEFLQNPQINRQMMDLIETFKREAEEMEEGNSSGSSSSNKKNVDHENGVSSEKGLQEKQTQKRRKGAKGGAAVVVNKEEEENCVSE